MHEVRVLAPAKVNLALRVGPPRPDGFHPLETVFEALDLFDEIVVRPAAGMSLSIDGAPGLATDSSNLAMRAAEALRARIEGRDGRELPGAHIAIRKRIPVAAGMAGGSADAAGSLVALNELWDCGLGRDELLGLAAELGSDVPFSLVGSLALGRGRGEELTSLRCGAMHSWVFLVSSAGLSTPAVFREFDRLAGGDQPAVQHATTPSADTQYAASPRELTAGLREVLAGSDLAGLAPHMINDLQPAAFSLRPDVARAFQETDGLGVARILSGSGPTIAILAADAASADALAAEAASRLPHMSVLRANGPAAGAHVVQAR